ncbi:hypothetical protein LguiA_030090 [Lonicera macranthoides]
MEMVGYAKKLLGEGLVTNEGEKWAKIRKIANHTFHAESLKRMIPDMSASVEIMLERWRHYEGKEIDVFKEFGALTTEVTSRTAFRRSYLEGKHIFEMVAKLTAITVKNSYNIRFPRISRIFKNGDEIEAEKLEDRIKKSILDFVNRRVEEVKNGEIDNYGSDYLGQLLDTVHQLDKEKRITMQQMVDEIKALLVQNSIFLTGRCPAPRDLTGQVDPRPSKRSGNMVVKSIWEATVKFGNFRRKIEFLPK